MVFPLLKKGNFASIPPVNKETSISQSCAHDTYFLYHLLELLPRTTVEVKEKSLLFLKYGYFSYKNTWICYRRPLFTLYSPCEARFIMDVWVLSDV